MSLEELLCTCLWKMSFEMSLDGLSLLLKERGKKLPTIVTAAKLVLGNVLGKLGEKKIRN